VPLGDVGEEDAEAVRERGERGAHWEEGRGGMGACVLLRAGYWPGWAERSSEIG
jgi:hypothetical protein